MAGTIVLLGSLPVDEPLRILASTFGWFIRTVPTIEELRFIARHGMITAVLFQPKEVHDNWREAIERVKSVAQSARLVVCQRFSERTPWSDIAQHGAFYQLHIPLASHELRQCMGFIKAAESKELRKRTEIAASPELLKASSTAA